MQFNPIALDNSYGTIDKYFGGLLGSLGYTGNVMSNNPAFYSATGDNGPTPDATTINPGFQSWANQQGITTSLANDGDYNIMRLMRGDQTLGEQRYKVKGGLDKFAEAAVPLAISLGTGGILGQALGFINPAMNPLDPSTWGAASGSAAADPLITQMSPELLAQASQVPGLGAAAGAAGAAGAAAGSSSGMLGGLLGGAGGGGGGGYKYTGPMPTITRGGWQPQAQANLMPTQSVVGALPQGQGNQYSGLLRYLGG